MADKKEGVKDLSITQIMTECAKLGFPMTLSADKWGWFKVVVINQRFKDKDPISCVRQAVEMIFRIKGVEMQHETKVVSLKEHRKQQIVNKILKDSKPF